MARPTPVLPDVGSTITLSGPRMPRRSASSTMESPMRSLMLPPGFARSAFIHTSTRASKSRLRRMCGVPPIVSRIELAFMAHSLLPAAGRGSVLAARDRVGELLLGHLRAPVDAERLGARVELLLGVPRHVDAAVRGLRPVARGGAALRRLRVRRALLVLELPVVATLLGDVLDRGPRRPVRARLRVVGLVRAVERLRVGALDLLRGTLERPR